MLTPTPTPDTVCWCSTPETGSPVTSWHQCPRWLLQDILLHRSVRTYRLILGSPWEESHGTWYLNIVSQKSPIGLDTWIFQSKISMRLDTWILSVRRVPSDLILEYFQSKKFHGTWYLNIVSQKSPIGLDTLICSVKKVPWDLILEYCQLEESHTTWYLNTSCPQSGSQKTHSQNALNSQRSHVLIHLYWCEYLNLIFNFKKILDPLLRMLSWLESLQTLRGATGAGSELTSESWS